MSSVLPEASISTHVSALSVANYFLARDAEREDSDITQMKLHKLLYYAQASYLAATGQRLFDSSLEAFEHGPVVDDVRRTFSQFGKQAIVVSQPSIIQDLDTPELPYDVVSYLDLVWDKFGDLSASKLRAMSHEDAPWQDNYDPYRRHCVIPDDEISVWFRSEDQSSKYVSLPNNFVVDEDVWDADSDRDDDFLANWVRSL